MLRGLAASRGVYEGPARRVSGPSEFDRIVQGRRPRHRVDDRSVQHPAAAARGDRDGQRRPALPLGDRRARVRDSGRGRDARGDRAHRRRGAGARRRRCRRGHGARVKRVVPLEKALDDTLFGSKAVGLGQAIRDGLPVPPGVALSGAIVEAVAAGEERAIKEVAKWVRPLGGPLAVRSSAVDEDGADGELRRPAPDAAQRPVGRRAGRGAEQDLVVGELGLGDHLPPARRPLHAPERRRRRPGAARSRNRRGDVHEEPGHRRRRAGDRGELGARRGGRRGARDPRPLPHRPLGPGARAKPGLKRIAIRSVPSGGTVEEEVPAELVERLCLDDAQLDELNQLAGRCEQVYGPGRDIEWAIAGGTLYLLQCRAITRARAARRPDARRPGRSPAARAALRRPEQARGPADRAPVQGASFAAGETVVQEGSGGAAFFVIESGEATVSSAARSARP